MLRSFAVIPGLAALILVPALCAGGAEPTGDEILRKVDEVFQAPRDKVAETRTELVDLERDARKTRMLKLWEKGQSKRLTKFLSPADQRGIAFLSLPGEVMYLYLPAFKKTRRIASHVKNRNFAGTDFTYEDMEAKEYAVKWRAERVPDAEDDEHYVIDETLRPGQTSDYGRLRMWVRRDNFYPTRTEYYDRGGNLIKVMTLSDIRQIDGYWEAMTKTMEDLRAKHKSIMTIEKVEFDTGLEDSVFTEAFLKR